MANDNNTVYIGKKPIMNYILAVVTHLNSDANSVLIKARGKSISTAVDVAEIVRRRHAKNAKVTNVTIDTEAIKREDGGTSQVSSIAILLEQ